MGFHRLRTTFPPFSGIFNHKFYRKVGKELNRTSQELMNERLNEKVASENGGITELIPTNA